MSEGNANYSFSNIIGSYKISEFSFIVFNLRIRADGRLEMKLSNMMKT